ncbi:MAG: 50S ribosomal protein L5, partial [bacterium]
MTPRILEAYRTEAVPALMKKFGYKNVMMVPRLEKISVNVGVG